MKFDSQTYRITEPGKLGTIALVVGVAGLVLSLVGYFVDADQFFHSYLTAFVFWITIGLGGLFFSMLHHLVSARWSVVIRRFVECLAVTVPVMAIFFIPIIFGMHNLYHWTHADAVASDQLLQAKTGYLNTPFFVIRAAIYFIIWFVTARIICKTSLKQDSSHDEGITKRMRIISAPGTILFALTITFASFDWVMSLDAHWYSTIFGVYIFAGSLLAMLSLITFVILRLQSNGILVGSITGEHYHDLGKLIFAFTIFWGYMAFSQYFLIWYGNIPEETVWFLHRWTGSWKTFSLILVFGHFVIPFFALFPQTPKRNPTFLKLITIWILIMHWIDLHWLVMPGLHHHGVHLSWMDLTTMMGIGGIVLWLFWRRLTSHPIVPVGDPNLEKSMKFISH